MIISRTPLRISFVGGGTDLPAYSDVYGGQVISTTIDKYVYVTVNEKYDGTVSLRYSEIENVDSVEDLRHTIVRECLRLFGIEKGIEIVTISDVPMNGTGLGSSSALTVGLLNALRVYKGEDWTWEQLARAAFDIEVNILGAPIGKQDQYAVAHGGFSLYRFSTTGAVYVEEFHSCRRRTYNDRIDYIEGNLMLFSLDKARDANSILQNQSENMEASLRIYHDLKGSVDKMRQWLDEVDPSIPDCGAIIDEGWQNKKLLGDMITDDDIDLAYKTAKEAGAEGGKVLGAGGGGFLMLIVPEDKQDDVRKALQPLQEMLVKFTTEGSEVIYDGS